MVKIAQCLCPQRHCMTALAGEFDADVLEGMLRQTVAEALLTWLHPYCGLCGATVATWTYEVGETKWQTMEEAKPFLREAEAEQAKTREFFRQAKN